MLDFGAVLPLSVQEIRVELDILLKAVVHNIHLVVSNELLILLRVLLAHAPIPRHVLMVCDPVDVHNLRSTIVGVALSIEDPSDLDLGPLYQMLDYLALHLDIPHHPSLLEVFVQDDALEPHLVLVICILRVVVTLVPPDEVEQDQTQVVAQVLMLLVADDLMVARELNLVLLDQLDEIAN